MTPFLLLAKLFGREQMTGWFTIISKLSSFFCWSRSIGVTDRSPPLSTIASLWLPTVLTISSWIYFLEEVGKSLKLWPPSLNLIITGVKRVSRLRSCFGGGWGSGDIFLSLGWKGARVERVPWCSLSSACIVRQGRTGFHCGGITCSKLGETRWHVFFLRRLGQNFLYYSSTVFQFANII